MSRSTRALLALAVAVHGRVAAATVVNDVTQLNPVAVARVVAPGSIEDVRRLVREHPGPISIGGGRFSMGGQTAAPGTLFIDMRRLDRVLALSPGTRTVTVEAGITWRKLQEAIDPYDLSIGIMQSYASFTVGGSLSVNVHGRYVNEGPIIHAVRSIQMVLADGRLVGASPEENARLFYGAIGGYGGLGVIVTATLALAPNEALERRVEQLDVAEYRRWFGEHVRGAASAVLHNADIHPPAWGAVTAITFSRTDRPVTVPHRLQTARSASFADRATVFWVSELPLGRTVRDRVLDPWRLRGTPVVWRNYEASYDVATLEPSSRRRSTYVLQEYFVPVDRFEEFVPLMAEILERYDVNVMNVSIRHATRDPGSLLAWAREECFAFVIYYKQGVERHERTAVGIWTRELVDAALSLGGSYYLPYQIHATDAQFHAAYPRARELFALKRELDPRRRFRNALWDRYLPPPAAPPTGRDDAAIRERLRTREGYGRAEEQTYLTAPEWYIVFSADEYAAFLLKGPPSRFPYLGSVEQFWRVYWHTARAAPADDFNWGYHAMIWTIGASFTAEYAAKGAYEGSIGRLSEWASAGAAGPARSAEDRFMQDLAGEYAGFMHATPWFEFPFAPRLRDLWTLGDVPGSSTVRRLERRLALSLDLGTKTAWGWLMKRASGAAYGAEDLEVQAWVRARRPPAAPGVRVLERLGPDAWLVAIPRYERFPPAVAALAADDARLVEVAGNRRILMTVLAPAAWADAPIWGDAVHEWPILTAPGRKRVAMTVDVDRLQDALPELAGEGVEVDHVFDY